jgi:hypothetical protein
MERLDEKANNAMTNFETADAMGIQHGRALFTDVLPPRVDYFVLTEPVTHRKNGPATGFTK